MLLKVNCKPVMYFPVLNRYDEDHVFFQEANELCAMSSKSSALAFHKTILGRLNSRTKRVKKFPCGADGCRSHFTCVVKYAAHYEASHRHACAVCGASLPSPFLLDLHLKEVHDSFFYAQSLRSPMFSCLVKGCTGVFHSHKDRGKHLVASHEYPVEFNDIVFGKSGGRRNGRGKHTVNKKKKQPKSSSDLKSGDTNGKEAKSRPVYRPKRGRGGRRSRIAL